MRKIIIKALYAVAAIVLCLFGVTISIEKTTKDAAQSPNTKAEKGKESGLRDATTNSKIIGRLCTCIERLVHEILEFLKDLAEHNIIITIMNTIHDWCRSDGSTAEASQEDVSNENPTSNENTVDTNKPSTVCNGASLKATRKKARHPKPKYK